MRAKKLLLCLLTISVLSTAANANPIGRKSFRAFLQRFAGKEANHAVKQSLEKAVVPVVARKEAYRIAYKSIAATPSVPLASSLFGKTVPPGEAGLFLSALPSKPWEALAITSPVIQSNAGGLAKLEHPDVPAGYIASFENFLELPEGAARIVMGAWARAESGAVQLEQINKDFLEDLLSGTGSREIATLSPRDEDLINAYLLGQARQFISEQGAAYGLFQEVSVGQTTNYFFGETATELGKNLFISPAEQYAWVRPVTEIVATTNHFEKDLYAILRTLQEKRLLIMPPGKELSDVSKTLAANYALVLAQKNQLPNNIKQLIAQVLKRYPGGLVSQKSTFHVISRRAIFSEEVSFAHKDLIASRAAHYGNYLYSSARSLLVPVKEETEAGFQVLLGLDEMAYKHALRQADRLIHYYIPNSFYSIDGTNARQARRLQEQKRQDQLDLLRGNAE